MSSNDRRRTPSPWMAPGTSPIQFGQFGSFQGGPQYAGLMGRPGAPMAGPFGGAGLTNVLAARLGLGGLPGVALAYRDGPDEPEPGAPAAPGGSGPRGPGGISGWLGQHGDALKGIGGALQGGAAVYGAISQNNLEKKRLRLEEERRERERRDQEAAAGAVAPGYAALLQALMGRMGYTGQGG